VRATAFGEPHGEYTPFGLLKASNLVLPFDNIQTSDTGGAVSSGPNYVCSTNDFNVGSANAAFASTVVLRLKNDLITASAKDFQANFVTSVASALNVDAARVYVASVTTVPSDSTTVLLTTGFLPVATAGSLFPSALSAAAVTQATVSTSALAQAVPTLDISYTPVVDQAVLLDGCADGTYKVACTPAYTGTSCADILRQHSDAPSGKYSITPLGSTTGTVAFCDMTSDGGGYTYVACKGCPVVQRTNDPNGCSQYGMSLVIPRSQAHWVSLYKYVTGTAAPVAGSQGGHVLGRRAGH